MASSKSQRSAARTLERARASVQRAVAVKEKALKEAAERKAVEKKVAEKKVAEKKFAGKKAAEKKAAEEKQIVNRKHDEPWGSSFPKLKALLACKTRFVLRLERFISSARVIRRPLPLCFPDSYIHPRRGRQMFAFKAIRGAVGELGMAHGIFSTKDQYPRPYRKVPMWRDPYAVRCTCNNDRKFLEGLGINATEANVCPWRDAISLQALGKLTRHIPTPSNLRRSWTYS